METNNNRGNMEGYNYQLIIDIREQTLDFQIKKGPLICNLSVCAEELNDLKRNVLQKELDYFHCILHEVECIIEDTNREGVKIDIPVGEYVIDMNTSWAENLKRKQFYTLLDKIVEGLSKVLVNRVITFPDSSPNVRFTVKLGIQLNSGWKIRRSYFLHRILEGLLKVCNLNFKEEDDSPTLSMLEKLTLKSLVSTTRVNFEEKMVDLIGLCPPLLDEGAPSTQLIEIESDKIDSCWDSKFQVAEIEECYKKIYNTYYNMALDILKSNSLPRINNKD